ncbi:ATP-dependent 6-phosphofructokinase [bacterium]|nr:ATP-dependent 6-phosphofructokinase [bacterium]
MKRIGVLTGGGDAAGMNAAVRAAVRTIWEHEGEAIGIRRGWQGLAEGDADVMQRGSVSGILHQGGTILRTFRYPEFATPEGDEPVRKALGALKLDGLVVIGGDGSFRGAAKLEEEFGLPVVGVPATIDNDIPGTDHSIGYDTALNIAVDAVDKIKDTASSHGRIFVIEVMGRNYGLLAAQCAMATGAEETLVPELDYSVDEICHGIETAYDQGKYHALIIVAEGAGRASQITYEINSRLNRPVRMVVLGHIQRGGAPTAFDRILATRIAHYATDLLFEGKHGVAVGIVANKFKTSSLRKRSSASKDVVLKNWELAQLLG